MGRHSNLPAAVAVAAVAMLGAACSGSPAPTSAPPQPPPGPARIVSEGTLRVCSTGDYRPFTYRDPQGQWSGMDIDLARDMARRLGVKLDLVPTTWNSMMADLGGT